MFDKRNDSDIHRPINHCMKLYLFNCVRAVNGSAKAESKSSQVIEF